MVHVNEAIWLEENGGTTWETLHRRCTMKKVIHKEDTARGRFDNFVDSDFHLVCKTSMYLD